MIFCRNARISTSLSRSPQGSSRSSADAFVTPRYASRSSGSIRVRGALTIMASASGTPVPAIAGLVAAHEDTVIHRFNEIGLRALVSALTIAAIPSTFVHPWWSGRARLGKVEHLVDGEHHAVRRADRRSDFAQVVLRSVLPRLSIDNLVRWPRSHRLEGTAAHKGEG